MVGLIVHDWAEQSGGAEKVLDTLLSTFPDAGLRMLWNDAPLRFPSAKESWMAKTPLRNHKALALPLMPVTWRSFRSEPTPDWVLASSHLFAHHYDAKKSFAPKMAYIHTPARYIWQPDLDSRGNSIPVKLASYYMKPLDRKRAQEAVALAANSEFTRARIQRVWDRDASVIYPPVEVAKIAAVTDWKDALDSTEENVLNSLPSDFLLGASRFVAYKGLDRVIEAGEALGLPVVLAGSGPLLEKLQHRADTSTVPVHIVLRPSDALLYSLYQATIALIFPAIEDFGIMPVEAMAAGAKVVAQPTGGAAETVRLMGGGSIVESFSKRGWLDAVDGLSRVDTGAARLRVMSFSAERFSNEIRRFVSMSAESLSDGDNPSE